MSAFSTKTFPVVVLLSLIVAGCTETGLEPPLVETIPAPEYVALSVGAGHACALDGEGRAFCWGENGNGQLGDGSTAGRSAPTPVGGDHRFQSIAAGIHATCGITTEAELLCWGGTVLPVPVGPAGRAWQSVSVGAWEHDLCAVDTNGQAFCGRIGGELSAFGGNMTWTAISVGGLHTCGITTAGAGYCWGGNGSRQLGVLQPYWSTDPVSLPGDDTWVELTPGNEYTCGTTTAGATRCWGRALYGALGTDTIPFDDAWRGTADPVTIAGGALTLTDLHAARVGQYSFADRHATCGFTTFDGRRTAVCWGDLQPLMNLGFGRYDWQSVQPGDRIGCGLTGDGRVLCWEPQLVGNPYFEYRGFVQLLFPDLQPREVSAPVVEWRDS